MKQAVCLSYRYDTLMENVLDPSHVPFSHHGVQVGRGAGRGGQEPAPALQAEMVAR